MRGSAPLPAGGGAPGPAVLWPRGIQAGGGKYTLPLAGGPLSFALVEVIEATGRRTVPVAELDSKPVHLTAPRPPFAGLAWDRPRIMGIVNVTPDSFSDGGRFLDPAAAIAHGRALAEAGADILDVGGESTRPGAEPVAEDEEIRRVVPVIRGLAGHGLLVSIDTRRAAVMAAALDAGARILNDVTALTGDPASLPLAVRRQAPVVLMHMQGDPRTMQADPHYDDVVIEVYRWLAARVETCLAAGLPAAALAVDYGIGFGKTLAHNLALLRHTALFHGLGVPLLVGVSRKGFIARLSRGEAAADRIPGSLAAALAALDQGAQMLRVHDVAETAQAVAVWQALVKP